METDNYFLQDGRSATEGSKNNLLSNHKMYIAYCLLMLECVVYRAMHKI